MIEYQYNIFKNNSENGTLSLHRDENDEVIFTRKGKELLVLLAEFMRFGLFTFGGGWSIIAQMQQQYVEHKKTITAEELLDLISVAKSVPGTMIANVGMLYGYRVHGLAGGLVCLVGMCLPPMLVMLVISFFYSAFRDNYWVNAAMMGMQAAVVPIIAGAAKNMIKGSAKYPPCVVVIAVSAALYLFVQINPVLLVVMGVICGLLIGGYYEGREAQNRGAA